MLAQADHRALNMLASAVIGSREGDSGFRTTLNTPQQHQRIQQLAILVNTCLKERDWETTTDLVRQPQIWAQLVRSLGDRYRLAVQAIQVASTLNAQSA